MIIKTYKNYTIEKSEHGKLYKVFHKEQQLWRELCFGGAGKVGYSSLESAQRFVDQMIKIDERREQLKVIEDMRLNAKLKVLKEAK